VHVQRESVNKGSIAGASEELRFAASLRSSTELNLQLRDDHQTSAS